MIVRFVVNVKRSNINLFLERIKLIQMVAKAFVSRAKTRYEVQIEERKELRIVFKF